MSQSWAGNIIKSKFEDPIPSEDLKDHFKTGGPLLHADETLEPPTTRYKGCGLATFANARDGAFASRFGRALEELVQQAIGRRPRVLEGEYRKYWCQGRVVPELDHEGRLEPPVRRRRADASHAQPTRDVEAERRERGERSADANQID